MDLGIPPLEVANLLGSSHLKSRFCVHGLTVNHAPDSEHKALHEAFPRGWSAQAPSSSWAAPPLSREDLRGPGPQRIGIP